MIEMLGVLAIIGVLSVGGIAGYSKAMEEWKVNKAISEYSYLIQGLLEHLDNLKHLSAPHSVNNSSDITTLILAKNLVPNTWTSVLNTNRIYDPYGNTINVFSRNQRMIIDVYFGKISSFKDVTGTPSNFAAKFCSNLLQKIVKPLAPVLSSIWFTKGKSFSGDKECGQSVNCIRNLSLSDIKQACDYCTNQENIICGAILEF